MKNQDKSRVLFIPAYSKKQVNPAKISEISSQLPKNLAIAYSIQYKFQAEQIKKILLSSHNIISFIQVLGCSAPKLPKSTQALLLISDGRFHAVSLACKTALPIYIYNMHTFEKISQKELQDFEKHKKSAYLNYLNSQKIGILISSKPGQHRLKPAEKLKIALEKNNKDVYLFMANDINLSALDNFDIDCWINTACQRLDFDFNSNKIINLEDLEFRV